MKSSSALRAGRALGEYEMPQQWFGGLGRRVGQRLGSVVASEEAGDRIIANIGSIAGDRRRRGVLGTVGQKDDPGAVFVNTG